MKLEDQVCSLENAKKLKELGIEKESLFFWVKPIEGWHLTSVITENDKIYFNDMISDLFYAQYNSAYLPSELMQFIPRGITLSKDIPFNSFRFRLERSVVTRDNGKTFPEVFIVNYRCDSMECEGEAAWLERTLFDHSIYDENLADCLAKTFIHLIEKKFI